MLFLINGYQFLGIFAMRICEYIASQINDKLFNKEIVTSLFERKNPSFT